MPIQTCFECGGPSDHQYYVVPRSLGGTKTVPLCEACLSKALDRNIPGGQELTRAVIAAKKPRGRPLERIPFGFDLVDDGRCSKDGNPIGLTVNHAEQAVIIEIRRLSAAGAGSTRIAHDLGEVGILTKTGAAKWSGMAVRRILSQPVLPIIS